MDFGFPGPHRSLNLVFIVMLGKEGMDSISHQVTQEPCMSIANIHVGMPISSQGDNSLLVTTVF